MTDNYCSYCQDDFTQAPLYLRGYRDLPVHQPGDSRDMGCAVMGDWIEFGRWETFRGSQGEMKWPDGREWEPEPATKEWTKDYDED